MIPARIIRSEAELADVAADSLVCPPYNPATVYQAGGDGVFVEPGEATELPAATVWETATGAHFNQILEEEREMWVLWDAAGPHLTRPPRGGDSPDWMAVTGLVGPGRTAISGPTS